MATKDVDFRVVWASESDITATKLIVAIDDGDVALIVEGTRQKLLARTVLSHESWRSIVEAVAEARSAAARGEAYEVTDRTAPDGGPILLCRCCRFEVAVDRETGSTLAHERAMGAAAHPEAF